jgi:nucleotide-binding universal stress UspA family protein
MFKDIVLAVTPSKQCAVAAEKAFGFAKRYDAKLYLVHVCGLEQGWGAMETLAACGETDRIKGLIHDTYKEELEQLDKAQVHVMAGVPHNEILRFVRRVKADLIIMGPHTKEFMEKRARMWGMAGSCLERVSKKAPCPVMIVANDEQKHDQSYDNILAATDFSDQAECAVAYGGQMARHYKGNLTVLHVVDPDSENVPMPELGALADKRKAEMAEIYESRTRGLNVNFECTEGDPAMEIIKYARMTEADIILMAHHAREPDPEKAFLGSTVVKVALSAPCPTMSINKAFDMRCGMMYEQSGEVAKA